MKIQKQDLICFIIIFPITLLIFYNFLTMHYAGDTYYIINNGYRSHAIHRSLNDGRLFMCLIELLADRIHLPITAFVIITLLLALVISCITVIFVKNIILKYKDTENKYLKGLVLLISYFTIFNFMYLENMYFVECTVMSASLIFHIISADALVSKGKYFLLKSSIFFILATFMYQGFSGFFLTILFLFTLLKNQSNIKQNTKDLCYGCFILASRNTVKLSIRISSWSFSRNGTDTNTV